MRVLVISNLFPTENNETRGVFNERRILELARHCEVDVVVPLPWWQKHRLTQKTRERGGVRVHYIQYWSVPGYTKLHGLAMYFSIRGLVSALHRSHPYDLLLGAWAYPDGYATMKLARQLKLAFAALVMGSDINEQTKHSALRPLVTEAMAGAQRIIAVSQALKAGLEDIGIAPEKVVVQNNGVDGATFHIREKAAVRRQLGLREDQRYILYVGNLFPVKGSDILVEAAGLLLKELPDTTLLLVGSGVLEESLKTRVAELGLRERIRFMGRKPHTEVPLWISACDVFCLPSRNEGCPNVVLEAVASGIPVVGTKVGGIPELVNENNGLLSPPEDPAALAQTLKIAIERTWSPEAIRASLPNLSWEAAGKVYYQTLVAAYEDYRKHATIGQ